MERIFIVGCGDIGRRVAALVRDRGEVWGLARSEESAEKLSALGIYPFAGDLDDPASLAEMPTRKAVVYFLAPPPGGGILDTRMRNFIAAIEPGEEPQKIIYVSTSGVYGDCGGALVTEATPPNPQTTRAKRRFDAETVVGQWGREKKVAFVILRVTGIYGPGRLPIARLQSGHPLLREEESPPTNRIHADDLARICVAAAERGRDGAIFNVSDGQPGTMTQYFNAVADLLGIPRPPQVSFEEARQVMNPLMLSYLTETRRMDNRKLRDELGIELLYPTLEAGLRASAAELEGQA